MAKLPPRIVPVEKKKRASLYARVSTGEQGELGHSLEAQEMLMRRYCETNDIEIVAKRQEVASGGDHPDKRQLKYLLDDLKKGKADYLIVAKLDRLSRVAKDITKLMEEFEEWGITFISINEKIDLSNALGRFMFEIMKGLSQMEKDLTSERVKMSLALKKDKGEMTGKVEWGKREIEVDGVKKVEDNPEEIETMKLLDGFRNTTHKLKNGRQAPQQWVKVAEEMVKAGRKNKNGEVSWGQSSVRYVYAQYHKMLATKD